MDKTKKTKQEKEEMEKDTGGETQMSTEMMMEEESFAKIFEDSLKQIQDGEVIRGKVLQITPDYVIIDVGFKSEGQIPLYEFYDSSNQANIKVGDAIDVLVEEWENDSGMMVLSKQKADQMKVWETIGTICEQDSFIEGKIVSRIKGGLSVDIGLKAFLPGSQVDLHPVRNLDRFIGETCKFKILKYNKKRGNVVLSRRVILEKERESLRTETLKN
ncbi:MAG: S1 RNA-binding domain-containing protein, partial [Proteobacteria bacterium]|nr:S1 RNA-binding domain-containing protein [Pseudomonadota bacterium]